MRCIALAPVVSGVDLRYGDRMNVIWLPETTEQGRAAKALFDLPERGVALLDKDNRLVWRASSSTRNKVEEQLRQVLN
jgi:hypothetical protein